MSRDASHISAGGRADFGDDVLFFAWVAAHNAAAAVAQQDDVHTAASTSQPAAFQSDETVGGEAQPLRPQQEQAHVHHHYHCHQHHHHYHRISPPPYASTSTSPAPHQKRRKRSRDTYVRSDQAASSPSSSSSSTSDLQGKVEALAEQQWSFAQRYKTQSASPRVVVAAADTTAAAAAALPAVLLSVPRSSASRDIGEASTNVAAAAAAASAAAKRIRTCTRCATTHSPEWRKSADKAADLCNACGLRMARDAARLSRRKNVKTEATMTYNSQ